MRPPDPQTDRKVRVLIIDDSAFVRRTIRGMLLTSPHIEVVGAATDGDEGLKLVKELDPDVITLDLEMPRLDGFSFLRILMRRRPRPVVVVSSLGSRENVLKSLELGALDFVAKPDRSASKALAQIRSDLVAKVLAGSTSLTDQLKRRLYSTRDLSRMQQRVAIIKRDRERRPAARAIVAIGTSTGGPTSLRTLIAALPTDLPAGIVVAQHMPPKFTASFAERLNRSVGLEVREAEDRELVRMGEVLIGPGGAHIELMRTARGIEVRLRPVEPADRYVPSVDRLLVSTAEAVGPRGIAIILTGMGSDGAMGTQYMRLHGGYVMAEHESTAVVFGMPREAIETGAVHQILPLELMPLELPPLIDERR